MTREEAKEKAIARDNLMFDAVIEEVNGNEPAAERLRKRATRIESELVMYGFTCDNLIREGL
jgi:hypothetical protein